MDGIPPLLTKGLGFEPLERRNPSRESFPALLRMKMNYILHLFFYNLIQHLRLSKLIVPNSTPDNNLTNCATKSIPTECCMLNLNDLSIIGYATDKFSFFPFYTDTNKIWKRKLQRNYFFLV